MVNKVDIMRKEICCKNWIGLFYYIENSSDLPSGFTKKEAVKQMLDGLIDNPAYLIQDPDDPDKSYPVKKEYLKDEKYWHSNEFSIKLFANAAKAIGGYRPLFQAGIIAGYILLEKAQPSRLQLFRLLSPSLLIKLISYINKKFNKTKNPKSLTYGKGYTSVKLNYSDPFKNKITPHVCDWNAGIYTGISKYTGVQDIKVSERKCLTRQDDDCVFEIHWTHLNFYRRLLIFFHSIFDLNYIRARDFDNLLLNDLVIRQQGIIESKTKELESTQAKLIETEKNILEHRITGGFAHEMRNALAGAQLEFKNALNYQGMDKSASRILKETATTLLKKISEIHEKYDIPKETVVTDFIPELKTIAEISEVLSVIHADVTRDIDRGLAITNQIRDYAKMSEIRPGNTSIDLVQLLKEYRSVYQIDFERFGIAYNINGLDRAVVQADEIHLNSIFSNLILNAKDALADYGKDSLHIDVLIEQIDNQVSVSIRDNGPGIEKQHLREIFEPFFSTKPKTGTGLGLGIVKRLTALYSGRITVSSVLGLETTFTVTLPAWSNGRRK